MKPTPQQTFGNSGKSPSYTKGASSKGALTENRPLDNAEISYGRVGKDGTIKGMQSLTTENLDDAGFTADGRHIVKHGTPYGEGALFNYLPPGMDITNQTMSLQNEMPLKKVTEIQYPGDGGFPIKDVPE